jgi:hypothetical protein
MTAATHWNTLKERRERHELAWLIWANQVRGIGSRKRAARKAAKWKPPTPAFNL